MAGATIEPTPNPPAPNLSPLSRSPLGSLKHTSQTQAVGVWTWNAGDKDDVCGICRVAFDSCPPDAKFPGDDSPVVWGQCGHAFHLQCITRWLNSQAEQRCPICRGAWEFKQLTTSETPPPLLDQGR
ncbi:anaphase-promoting complex subunit 11 [Candidatus Dependentiae bacterium]|nr:anaphase-promoting complex subunit 11 [Candidatus Dependentiae bacterium]